MKTVKERFVKWWNPKTSIYSDVRPNCRDAWQEADRQCRQQCIEIIEANCPHGRICDDCHAAINQIKEAGK